MNVNWDFSNLVFGWFSPHDDDKLLFRLSRVPQSENGVLKQNIQANAMWLERHQDIERKRDAPVVEEPTEFLDFVNPSFTLKLN